MSDNNFIRSFKLRPGSHGLLALRWSGLIVCFGPSQFAGREAIARSIGRVPHLVSAPGPVEVSVGAAIGAAAGPSMAGAAFLGTLLFLVLDWLSTAVACDLLGPLEVAQPVKLARRLWNARQHLGPLARLAGLTLILLGAGSALLGGALRPLWGIAAKNNWNPMIELVGLPAVLAGLVTLWAALVASVSTTASVLIVVDRRRRARRAVLEAVRVGFRAPWLMLPLAIGPLAIQLLGASILVAVYPPKANLGGDLLWLLYLGVHCYLWHWLTQWTLLLYAHPRFDDIRARGDIPLSLFARCTTTRDHVEPASAASRVEAEPPVPA